MNSKKYRPIHQLPYCCVPATLQWIFYRRNLDILDQITIGSELGLRVPELFLKYFENEKIKILSSGAKEYGTQILKEEYSINRFFQHYKIPLTISKEFNFNNIDSLKVFLQNNFKENIDIIVRFNNAIFKRDDSAGHFGLIVGFEYENDMIVIGDPEPPFFKNLNLNDLLLAISNKLDGVERGLYIVTDRC
jgi:hypothetical protein